MGPGYKQPVVKLQPYHNAPTVEARTPATPVPSLDTWWTGFNDPALTNIVERALAQNLDLAGSFARVEQARAAAKEAGAKRLPNFDLEGDSNSFRQSLDNPIGRYANLFPGFDRNQSYLDLGVGATWETDIFGSLRRGAEAANTEAQAAEAERFGTRVSVVAEAADAYMQIRGAQVRLAFAKEHIATDEHLLQLVLQRKNAGVASDRELAQAEALLAQAKATVPILNIILEAQLNRLDVLMGAQPGTYAAQLTTPSDIPVIPGIANALDASDLLRRRPDIIAAERRVAASNARIGQAIAEYYPKISLSALLGNEAISPGDLFRERAFQPTAVAGLRWRLFDFGRVDAEVRQARGANAEALVQYRSSVLRATEDVEDAFSALAQSELRSHEVSHEISSLQRVKDLSEQSYKAGVIPLTDVLDANRQLLMAKDDLASTRETAARAAVSSFRALGGGWTP
ncbi:Outer membrane component of tripartite multidrug resistance system [Acidisarcina polymorpha]|uniref:Outer membrane component of tripartite multidrug resistance system n=1 Tax=Acidisarcina polymorpha TaxID=2211140 RepID=A0A2Z5G661_9BACT|nr:TolC family protein [Acidisarcina polymorpha]AXC14115.1 Outer membrane component of tripartite multidrug resistance system [Acidisarcina polymorpha]